MRQELTTDTVSRYIEASPQALYALVSDVTRTPEYSPEVVKCTWKKGATDKPHSHPLPFVVYALDDCTLRVHNPDGTTRELKNKAGGANAVLGRAALQLVTPRKTFVDPGRHARQVGFGAFAMVVRENSFEEGQTA